MPRGWRHRGEGPTERARSITRRWRPLQNATESRATKQHTSEKSSSTNLQHKSTDITRKSTCTALRLDSRTSKVQPRMDAYGRGWHEETGKTIKPEKPSTDHNQIPNKKAQCSQWRVKQRVSTSKGLKRVPAWVRWPRTRYILRGGSLSAST